MTNNKNTVVFTQGLPGAGKSTVIANRYGDCTIIDPDAFKKMHPDYDPKNPGLVHEWSKEQSEAMFRRLLAERAEGPIVVDGTGTNAEKIVRRMREAAAAGYETELVYVKVRIETAIERNAKRARTVPEALIREKAEDIEVAHEIAAREATRAVVVDND